MGAATHAQTLSSSRASSLREGVSRAGATSPPTRAVCEPHGVQACTSSVATPSATSSGHASPASAKEKVLSEPAPLVNSSFPCFSSAVPAPRSHHVYVAADVPSTPMAHVPVRRATSGLCSVESAASGPESGAPRKVIVRSASGGGLGGGGASGGAEGGGGRGGGMGSQEVRSALTLVSAAHSAHVYGVPASAANVPEGQA